MSLMSSLSIRCLMTLLEAYGYMKASAKMSFYTSMDLLGEDPKTILERLPCDFSSVPYSD